MKCILAGITLAFLLTAAVAAQSTLTGKYQGDTPNGMTVVLDVTATKHVLTGTLTRQGKSSEIQDGKITEKNFTFKAVLGEQTETFTGQPGKDDVKVWLDRQGEATALTLKRVKK